jgi:hypothetical protein
MQLIYLLQALVLLCIHLWFQFRPPTFKCHDASTEFGTISSVKLVLSPFSSFNKVFGLINCEDKSAPGHDKYLQLPIRYCPQLPFAYQKRMAHQFLNQQCLSPQRLEEVKSALRMDDIMKYIVVEKQAEPGQLTVGMTSEIPAISIESVFDAWVRIENDELGSKGVAVFEKAAKRIKRFSNSETLSLPGIEELAKQINNSRDIVKAEYFPEGNYWLSLIAYSDFLLVYATEPCRDHVCSICLTEESTRPCRCGHWFHPECIKPWQKDDGICPVCRRAILM